MKKKAIIISIKGYKILEKEREILRNEKPWGLILFKRNINNLNQIKKLISPNSVNIMKYNNQKISDDFVKSVITFIFSFLFIFLIIALLLSLTGLDFVTAVSGAASAISNVGPGLGDMIGPNGNYKNIPDVSKWILSFAMLLGRLEIFAILVLLFPSFWRN